MPSPEAVVIESLLRIANKEGEDVDFRLNSAQRRIDEAATGRDLVPKARQEGVSSYILARFFAACLMYRNTRAVVVSHDAEATQRLLNRVHYFVENIKGPKPVIKNKSASEITFPKMNSAFWIGTAGSRQFGRGDTITHLHGSEYAFWPKPQELMRGLLQAVPYSGEVWLESTGNGYNDYHKRCMRAAQGSSVWTVHFLSWVDFDEYRVPLTNEERAILKVNLREEWDEPALYAEGIDLEQLAWRRMKLDELDYDVNGFKQEYPRTLDECFQMSSESIFVEVKYAPTKRWKKVDRNYHVLEGHPVSGCTYVTGSDVAAGVGKDSSGIEVFCLDTQEQVAEYVNDRIDPEAFAPKIAEISKHFNNALAVVEQNNHGILTLSALKKIYPGALIFSDPRGKTSSEEQALFKLGYRTTSRSRPLMIGRLRTKLAHEWTIHSPLLRDQLSTFIENDSGKLEAQDGCHDDLVIAAACAATGENRAFVAAGPKFIALDPMDDPFSLDSILHQLKQRGFHYPIAYQHKGPH